MYQYLDVLLALQKIDGDADELQAQDAAFDPQLKKMAADIEAVRKRAKDSKAHLISLQSQKKQLDLDIDAKEKLVAKHQAELSAVKSNDAYKALLNEIAAAKDEIHAAEDRDLAVMEQIEAAEKTAKESEKGFKEEETALQAQLAAIELKRGELRAKISAVASERKAAADAVPAEALSRYEAIREKRGSLVVVPVEHNCCTGCHMTLSPGKTQEMQKTKGFIMCDSCTRILFMRPTTPA